LRYLVVELVATAAATSWESAGWSTVVI